MTSASVSYAITVTTMTHLAWRGERRPTCPTAAASLQRPLACGSCPLTPPLPAGIERERECSGGIARLQRRRHRSAHTADGVLRRATSNRRELTPLRAARARLRATSRAAWPRTSALARRKRSSPITQWGSSHSTGSPQLAHRAQPTIDLLAASTCNVAPTLVSDPRGRVTYSQ